MSEAEEETEEPKKKSGITGLILPIALFLIGAGGGFFALYSGLILAPEDHASVEAHEEQAPYLDPAETPSFVPLQPIMVTLGRAGELEQLRFEGYLEVQPGSEEAVTQLMPRVMDVLNGYLRAVEIGDLSDPSALMTLRAQMLRRIQVVMGEGVVNDLLISTFLLS